MKYYLYALLIILAGCTCASDNNTIQEVDPITRADIRFVHVALGNGRITVVQNDRLLNGPIEFGALPEAYSTIPSGIRNLRCLDSARQAIFSLITNLEAEKSYSMIIFDTAGSVNGLIVKDDPIPPAFYGVRIMNLSKYSDNLQIVIENHSGDTLAAPSSITYAAYTGALQFNSLGTVKIHAGNGLEFNFSKEDLLLGKLNTIFVYKQSDGQILASLLR
jgi:hypothetical protein